MTEDAKVIYQAIGKAAGVNVLFDPDYISKRIQVDLNNVSLLDALRIVGTMSGTFWRPVTSNTIFVAQNTRVKRTELDEQAVQTFYLSNAWQQNDLNDVQTALRNVLTNAKVYGVASQNAIVMRGTPDELLLAQKLINDLDKARPEVVVDIAVLEVSKNWERNLGIAWPSSVGVALQPPNSQHLVRAPAPARRTGTDTTSLATLYNLAHLKANNFAVTVGSATANLLLTDTNTKILQNPRIRATDEQKATHEDRLANPHRHRFLPDRRRNRAGQFAGQHPVPVSGRGREYRDDADRSLRSRRDPEDQDRSHRAERLGHHQRRHRADPQPARREQVIRLREGEANILGGIQNQQEQENWSGIPGLSSIPILKYIFGSKDHTIQNDEIVFLVVPHVVRSQELDPANLRTIDTGAGQSIDLRLASESSASAASCRRPPFVPPRSRTPSSARFPARALRPRLLLDGTVERRRPEHCQIRPRCPAAARARTSAARPQPHRRPATPPAAALESATSRSLRPRAPLTAGATFQVPVVLNGATDIASVPLQLQYDPAKLSLVNVAAGDLLNRDGQAVALIHRDDGPGNVTVVAARPPGAAGISGAGSVCVLTFQAKAAGDTHSP